MASLPEFVAPRIRGFTMADGAAASVPDSDSGLGSGLGAVSLGSLVSDAHSVLGSGSVSLGSCSDEVLSGELSDAEDGGTDESEADGVSSEDIVGHAFHEQACAKMATESGNVI